MGNDNDTEMTVLVVMAVVVVLVVMAVAVVVAVVMVVRVVDLVVGGRSLAPHHTPISGQFPAIPARFPPDTRRFTASAYEKGYPGYPGIPLLDLKPVGLWSHPEALRGLLKPSEAR